MMTYQHKKMSKKVTVRIKGICQEYMICKFRMGINKNYYISSLIVLNTISPPLHCCDLVNEVTTYILNGTYI